MKIWLDDVRDPPKEFFWAKHIDEAKEKLLTGEVEQIWIDHDLGTGCPTGYELACLIEQWAAEGKVKPPVVLSQSLNPEGRRKIMQAGRNAERLWLACQIERK